VIAGVLSEPGDIAVVRAEQPGGLLVKIIARNPGDPQDASFRLEPLSGASRENAVVLGAAKIRAHVSRRGDVETEMGSWISGPNEPAAIEGLEVCGQLSHGLSLDLQPLISTKPPRWMEWSRPGNFAGTRGKALPLAGLRLRLSGTAAPAFEIVLSALFLGSPVATRRGREIEIVSESGVDPLVGLRIEILKSGLVLPEKAASGANAVSSPSSLRVLRASLS
jgi:hypothetical protein